MTTTLAAASAAAVIPAASAAALPDRTWSGLAPMAASHARWSAGANWIEGAAPQRGMGTMHFPALTSGPCTTPSPSAACYQSTNDMAGLTVSGVTIDDGASYSIGGSAIAIGAGGITAAPDAGVASQGSPYVSAPVTLTAPQSWSITGGSSAEQLALAAPVSGQASALTVGLSNQTSLGLYADDEVGPVRVTGTGAPSNVHIGFPQNPGALNATDGNPVTFSGGANLVADPGATGPLTMHGGDVQVGDPYSAGTLSVTGAVTLDSTSTVSMYLRRPGNRGGSDFSQLSATGDVNLGAAHLDLSGQEILGEALSCPALTPGEVDTLVATTGRVSGTFAGMPDGTTIPLGCPSGGLPAPTVTINYTANSVTATVQTSGGTPTTTMLSPSPARPITNQAVTLTATVATGSGQPLGNVEFDSNGTPITGCANERVTTAGQSGTATCQASFTAASSTDAVSAEFRPTDNSPLQGSINAVALTVDRSPTTTTLTTPDSTPLAGTDVTYTATVAGVEPAGAQPSGAVEFRDGGAPIGACSARPVTPGTASSTATCTVTYPAGGAHTITATYLADSNFLGSDSPSQDVTVRPAPIASVSPPRISGTPVEGQALTEVHGSWSGAPSAYTYGWEACDVSGGACAPIGGAVAQTHVLTGVDVGRTIRVQETAIYPDGRSASAMSAATPVVQAALVQAPVSQGGAHPVRGAMHAAPRCTLALSTRRIFSVRGGRPKRSHLVRKPGALALRVACDQDATFVLRGTVSWRIGGHTKGRRRVIAYRLTTVTVRIRANGGTSVSMRVPVAAAIALQRGASETATITARATSVSGTTALTLAVSHLRW